MFSLFVFSLVWSLNLQLSLYWHTIPKGFCVTKNTRQHGLYVWLLVAMFLSGVSEIVHPLESLREEYMPFNMSDVSRALPA